MIEKRQYLFLSNPETGEVIERSYPLPIGMREISKMAREQKKEGIHMFNIEKAFPVESELELKHLKKIRKQYNIAEDKK